jgi:hypothetical protein
VNTGEFDRASVSSRFTTQRLETQSNKDDMTESPPNHLDRNDWAARASEALAQAEKLPARLDAMQSHQKRAATSLRRRHEEMADTETANGAPKATG